METPFSQSFLNLYFTEMTRRPSIPFIGTLAITTLSFVQYPLSAANSWWSPEASPSCRHRRMPERRRRPAPWAPWRPPPLALRYLAPRDPSPRAAAPRAWRTRPRGGPPSPWRGRSVRAAHCATLRRTDPTGSRTGRAHAQWRHRPPKQKTF